MIVLNNKDWEENATKENNNVGNKNDMGNEGNHRIKNDENEENKKLTEKIENENKDGNNSVQNHANNHNTNTDTTTKNSLNSDSNTHVNREKKTNNDTNNQIHNIKHDLHDNSKSVENKLIECIMEENDTLANIQKQIQQCRMLISQKPTDLNIEQEINKYKRKEIFPYLMTSGEMFEIVETNHIFSDSKHFVDMVLKTDAMDIKKLFYTLFIQSGQKNNKIFMLNFIKKFFYEPGFELAPTLPQDFQPHPNDLLNKIQNEKLKKFAIDLNNLWKMLFRKLKPEIYDPEFEKRTSLLLLKHPDIIIAGGRFRELYYWDSYWIIRGALVCGMLETPIKLVENMIDFVNRYGCVPNGSRTYYVERSQPPVLTKMVFEIFQRSKDVAWLQNQLPALIKEYEYWNTAPMKMKIYKHFNVPLSLSSPQALSSHFKFITHSESRSSSPFSSASSLSNDQFLSTEDLPSVDKNTSAPNDTNIDVVHEDKVINDIKEEEEVEEEEVEEEEGKDKVPSLLRSISHPCVNVGNSPLSRSPPSSTHIGNLPIQLLHSQSAHLELPFFQSYCKHHRDQNNKNSSKLDDNTNNDNYEGNKKKKNHNLLKNDSNDDNKDDTVDEFTTNYTIEKMNDCEGSGCFRVSLIEEDKKCRQNEKQKYHHHAHKSKKIRYFELSRFYSSLSSPRPESHWEDINTAKQALTSNNKIYDICEIYRNLRATAASGWDFSSRWCYKKRLFKINEINQKKIQNNQKIMISKINLYEMVTCNVIPVDLNAILYGVEEDLSYFYKIIGNEKESQKFEELSNKRAEAMVEILWNEKEQQFCDYNFDQKCYGIPTIVSNWIPLWFPTLIQKANGILKKKYYKHFAFDLVKHLAKKLKKSGLITKGGIVTSLLYSLEQWDYPNCWAPLNHFVIEGLYKLGEKEFALELANKWIANNYHTYVATEYMHEKYDCREYCQPGKGGEYLPQTGFGFTNGTALCLLDLFSKDLQI